MATTTFSMTVSTWQEFLYSGTNGWGGYQSVLLLKASDGNKTYANFMMDGKAIPESSINTDKNGNPYGVLFLPVAQLQSAIELLNSGSAVTAYVNTDNGEAYLKAKR